MLNTISQTGRSAEILDALVMSKRNFRFLIGGALALTLVLTSAAAAGTRSAPAADPLAALPMAFIPNQGQVDAAVRFHARGLAGQIFFTDREVVLALPADVLRLRFAGARPAAEVSAGAALPGTFNSFVGNDPRRWSAGSPTYGGIAYRQLYAGVDLAYNGRAGALKGTYTVARGVDPGTIQWRYDGATGLRVDPASGDLHITLASGGSVVENAPVAWQDIDGERRPVDVGFVLHASGSVGFRVADFAAEHPLVIDPTLVYSTYLGDSGQEEGQSIAVDEEGFIYVTGQTDSLSFPLANPLQPVNVNASAEAFIFKLDPASNTLIYSTYLGGDDWEIGSAIAVDAYGNAYVTGETASFNFPVTGHLQPVFGTVFDAFVVKVDAGGGLVFSTYLGGSDWDFGAGIAVDPVTEHVVVAGTTASVDFPVVDAWQGSLAGSFDFFLTWLDASGTAIVRSTLFGGGGFDVAHDLALDANGRAVVAGFTESSNLPVVNAAQPFYSGDRDAAVAKFDLFSGLIYSTYLGGSGYDSAEGVAADRQGDTFVTGITESSNFPLAGSPVQSTPAGAQDVFVTRLDASGGPIYSTYLGGSDYEFATAVAVDAASNAYVTGLTDSANFPSVDPLQSPGGYTDTFVSVLDASGGSYLFSTFFGGSNMEIGFDIAVAGDDAYLTGSTGSVDLPLARPWQGAHQGITDVFVAVIDTGVAGCQEIFSPAAIPAPAVIDFDALSGGTVLGTIYQASHGVIFENSFLTRAAVYGSEPALAISPPNVASNDAYWPFSSSYVPMLIEFTAPKTHVGMWIGNGELQWPTAVLTAYDAGGVVVCQSVRPGVTDEHSLFIGLGDPAGRIASVALDYGSSVLSESIDDLTLAP